MKHSSKKNSISFTLLLVSSLLLATPAFADVPTFEATRAAAFNGKRPLAIEMCRERLQEDPEDRETRTLLGRLYTWEGNYDKARSELDRVLNGRPQNVDARSARIDVELYAYQPDKALSIADGGLELVANNGTLLFKKSKALKALGRKEEAVAIVRRAVEVDPLNADAQDFLTSLSVNDPLNTISFSVTRDEFNAGYEPWTLYSLSLSRRFSFGSVIARVNRANRFDTEGHQFEIDAYPKLRDGTYLYLNAGHSADSIFPKNRLGAELYQSLGNGWETSFGTRHLVFSSSTVNIYTGSVGKYLGNYYFLLRGNLTPDRFGESVSASLQSRRYFGDEDYISLTLGTGESVNYRDSFDDIVVLDSKRAGIDLYGGLSRLWYGSAGISYEHEEVRKDAFRDHWTFSLGLERRF